MSISSLLVAYTELTIEGLVAEPAQIYVGIGLRCQEGLHVVFGHGWG